MKKIFITLVLTVLFYSLSYCGDVKFVVLTANGSVSLIRSAKTVSLKSGDKIYDNDKIKIGKKSYLNLVYSDGRTLELKSAGTYTSSKLITMVNAKNNSSTKKFSNFVLAEFVKSVDDMGNMKVTGSVERIVKASIDYCTPVNTNLLDPVVTLNWFAVPGNSYTFRLADMSGNILFSKDLSDTSITLDLQQLNLSRENTYKWFVKDNKKEKALTDTCRILWVSESSADSIKKAEAKLLKEMAKLDHSMKQTILASFYSDNRLYVDMMQSYQRAMELSPDNEIIKKLYYSSLTKTGLGRMANAFKSKLN